MRSDNAKAKERYCNIQSENESLHVLILNQQNEKEDTVKRVKEEKERL
jgi:hypothetical protein